jgi:hypothetical protein
MAKPDQIITVEFEGPFSWVVGDGVPAIADSDNGKKKGVYLWTVQLDDGELIYYVGQTGRSFDKRMFEHFVEHMSGGYHLWDPSEFSRGQKVQLWPGRYGRDKETSPSVFVQQFQTLAPSIEALAKLYRFFLAPLDCDERLRNRIEAAIARCLYDQPGIVGEFQDQGIVYRPRRDGEVPVQALVRCRDNLLGVPDSLWV